MENSIIFEYYKIILEKMKVEKLLGEDGVPLSQSENDFTQYCKQILQDSALKTLWVEVIALENLTSYYQERFNIIGSVHKAFFEETLHGKKYKHLHIEQMLLAFQYTPIRFMDWLLERYCYTQFSEVLSDYIEYLHQTGLEACYDSLSKRLYCRLYSK